MRGVRLRTSVLMALAGWLVFADLAVAAGGDWSRNDHVEMRLISAVQGVGDRDMLPLGLQFRMKPGWKLYWRSPGDAGFPPRPNWEGSDNIAEIKMDWPAPTRFSIFDLETLGYVDEVILPLTAKLGHPGEPVTVKASVDYLTCKDICIPYTATVELSLAAGEALPSELSYDLDRYRARVPGSDGRHGLEIIEVQVASAGETVDLQVVATALEPFSAPDLFVEGLEGTFFGKPEITLSEGGRTANIAIRGGGLEEPLGTAGVPLILTLVDGARMLEKAALGQPGSVNVGIRDGAGSSSIWYILLLALLGGLILNLMPCVLPVLSLKLLSVVSYGGRNTADVRRGFLATAAGIVFSFLLIAGALIGFQSAGFAIGWGIQFQQPLFLVIMTLIVLLFACNLFGLFEIILPGRVADLAGTAGNTHSLGGHFLTGAFATLLATPCSAPFLGTAVGFALSRGPVDILSIFLFLGVGLSLPYLLVAAVPQLATRLPRPGRWMVWLRRILGLALVATAVWLVSVLAALLGLQGALSIAALAALIVVVLALRRLPGSQLGRHAGKGSLLLAAAAIAVGGLSSAPSEQASPILPAALWQPFDQAEIQRLTAQGKSVFVDVTADWCLTCQVNKKLVLDRSPVADWLAGEDVVAMRADWTRPNAVIAAYLARFGRYGIPFNAVYGPQAPNGIALPELLTSGDIASAAEKADSSTTLAHRE